MKKIYIALFALLAVGSTFTACTEEEPFATVTENDDPHILAPVFPDRTNGQLATFANISRDANLSIALTVTPKDYTTVTWFIDGQEVESGTDSDKEINRSLKAGTYNLKIEVETVKEGDPKVKDFKGSSFFVWITPDGHNERMNA